MATEISLPTSLDQLDPAVRSAVERARTIVVPVDDGSDAAAAGVNTTAFQHLLPGDEALTDTVNELGADLVVVPVSLDSPGFLDRLEHDDFQGRAVGATPAGVPVVAVADDGTLTLAI